MVPGRGPWCRRAGNWGEGPAATAPNVKGAGLCDTAMARVVAPAELCGTALVGLCEGGCMARPLIGRLAG